MFASDLSFSKAIMAARLAERRQGAPSRVHRLPAGAPVDRRASRGGR